jgi:hypothetical protein
MFAQLTHSSWTLRRLGSAVIVAGLSTMVLASEASADTYNFWLKSGPNTPYLAGTTKCAAGSFDFTKTGVTTGAPVSSLTMNISSACINTGTPSVDLAMSGSLSAVVRDINLNGEAQGPNVDGVTGVLTSPQFVKVCDLAKGATGTQLARWDVIFSSSAGTAGAPGIRTFKLQESIGLCAAGTPDFNSVTTFTLVSDAPYHVFNTTHQIPEPETLWLAFAGLGALALARRKRK